MSEKRNLEFFLANPDQMPGDLAELDGLMAAGDGANGENEQASETGEQGAASGAEAGKEGAAETGAAAKVAAESAQQEQVIKSKDGKHEIPYSVLQAERTARQQAEGVVAQMQERLAALEQQAKTGQPAAAAEQTQTAPAGLTAEELAQVAEDFPSVAKLIQGMAARMETLTTQLDEVRHSEQARGRGEAQRASATVQEAIDANPVLTYWQQKDADMFNEAVKLDNQIRANPRMQGLSLDDRFGKVVSSLEAVYGPTQLPPEYQRQASTAGGAKPAPKVDPQQVAAAAQKAIESAQASSAVRSLSDIPGGAAPETDEIAQLGLMSATDLGNKFLNMDPASVMKILARAA